MKKYGRALKLPIYWHFRNDSDCDSFKVQILHKGNDIITTANDNIVKMRREAETEWIKLLKTKYRYGLNLKLDGTNVDKDIIHNNFVKLRNLKNNTKHVKPRNKRVKDYSDVINKLLNYNTMSYKSIYHFTMILPVKYCKKLISLIKKDKYFDKADLIIDLCKFKISKLTNKTCTKSENE